LFSVEFRRQARANISGWEGKRGSTQKNKTKGKEIRGRPRDRPTKKNGVFKGGKKYC